MTDDRELMSGMLSKTTRFRLIVSGPVGAKEIERLIRKLEIDRDILAAPETPQDPEALTDQAAGETE